MYCNNCGNQIPENTPYCPTCGAAAQPSPAANSYPQQPNYQPNGYPEQPAAKPGKGFAIASLVLGIVSFFLFGYIAGGLAIIFGSVAKNKGYPGGIATAGMVCGIIGIAMLVLFSIIF